MIRNGWPQTVTEVLKPYFVRRLDLNEDNGCIYFDQRVVVPEKLRKAILEALHETHTGIVRTKSLAKIYFWWPGMDADIQNFISNCKTCEYSHTKPSSNHHQSWPEAKRFFERIHLNFFYFQNTNFLIVVDAFSQWIDVKDMKITCAGALILELRRIFSYFGLPNTIVSDNGPPFNSAEFKDFCTSNSIKFLKSPPYHPQSNGAAERAVQTVKNGLRKSLDDNKTKTLPLTLLLSRFLLNSHHKE